MFMKSMPSSRSVIFFLSLLSDKELIEVSAQRKLVPLLTAALQEEIAKREALAAEGEQLKSQLNN